MSTIDAKPLRHEAHLTVSPSSHAEPALRAWLAAHGLRLTAIELSRGASPLHTMVTGWLDGETDAAILRAHAMAAGLSSVGVGVTRIKLELPHVRRTLGARALYLEHHVKVRVAPARLAVLASVGAAHDAHVSRNPRRVIAGVEERFLTQRFAAEDSEGASVALSALVRALRQASLPIVRVERERVVHDNNPRLDAGWRREVTP
jgi:hypothetical protein